MNITNTYIYRTASRVKKLLIKLWYGKMYNEAFYNAEKSIAKKVHNIDLMFSRNERRKIFREGFCSDKLIWYDFKDYKKTDYISDFEHYTLTESIDKHQFYIANDKLVCERMLAPFCNIMPTVGYIFRGKYTPIGEQGVSLKDLIDNVKSGKDYYLKPNGFGGGHGIGRLSFHDGSFYWNDKTINNVESFIEDLAPDYEGYLVQERFMQKGFSHDVCPDTLNTVRVVTMLSPETNEPFVAWAFHRFGKKGAFVDNVAKENFICPINIKTGIIEKAIIPPVNGKLTYYERHPDTNVQIVGVKCPMWEEIIELTFKLAKQLPFLPLCGWDIVVSDDKLYMQELNFNPDIYAGQILYPLLIDSKVKDFINYYRNLANK